MTPDAPRLIHLDGAPRITRRRANQTVNQPVTVALVSTDLDISCPQIRESFEGTIHRSFRAEGAPTYFLLGAKGEILDAWVGGGLAIERVSKYLASH